jgi:MerR-like DNA binding protein
MRKIATSRTESLTIGKLSRLTGVHIETIRYYERLKMLPKPPRTTGGRRTYDHTHMRVPGDHVSWAFPLMKFARCFGSGPKKHHAAKFATLPWIVSTIFEQRLPIFVN